VEWRLLSMLSEPELRSVLGAARRRTFARGETIFHEGDPGDALHLLAQGWVALRVTTPLGDTAMLAVLGPGDYFGEMAIVSPAPRNSTVVALAPVETMSLSREQLNELRKRYVAVDEVLLGALAGEVRRLSHQLLEAMYVPVDKRVPRRLLELAGLFDMGGHGPITVPLTQEDLAELAGTTRPSVNKVLKQAEQAGAVDLTRGRIIVKDRELLARRAR